MSPFTSNHAKLIKDCYPPKPEGVPSAVSNNLGKLTFYAAGRPKKLPKVSTALLERAEKDSKSNSGPKGRAGLAVTLDIYKGLATECRSDLRVFGEQALRVVEMGLSRKDGTKRDPDMEARAASLFRAVSTFMTGPFVGLSDAQGKQYLRCLALLSAMARLGKDDALSRATALGALQGVAESEVLYSQTADYDSAIEEIVPALLYNMAGEASSDLTKHSTTSDVKVEGNNFGSLESRKSGDVAVPSDTPTSSGLAASAVKTFKTISQLSHGAQLSSELSAVGSWLDTYQKGSLWQDRNFVHAIGSIIVATSPVQYRSAVVSWWADQVSDIDDADSTVKSEMLLSTLTAILRGETSLVGIGIGSVLDQLLSLVVRRAPLGDDDPLVSSVLTTVASLASSRIYYVDQVNDVVADVIETIRSVRDGTGVGARLMGRSEKKRATRRLVGALREILAAASANDGRVQITVPAKNETTSSIVGKANGSASGDGRSEKQNGGDHKDALGRPVMQIQSSGQRSRVSPDVFGESLFLLTDPDATTRRDYERALLVYLEQELAVAPITGPQDGPVIDPTHQLEGFFRRLHVAVYELATSSTLTRTAISPELAYDGGMERSSSRMSRRQSVSSGYAVSAANAVDFAALAVIAQTVQARKSPLAVSEGVPMLLTLYSDAERWANESAEKAQACREMALYGLRAMAEAWSISEVSQIVNEILPRFGASVLPRLQSRYKSSSVPEFAAQATGGTAPSLPLADVIDAALASRSLQDATGPGLANTLNSPWTAHRDQHRVNRKSTLMSNGSRSVTNLSNSLRVTSASSPDRPHSLGAPSLADLQSSLGHQQSGSNSVRGERSSATPSIASTSGTGATGTITRQRSQRKNRDQVLSSLQLSHPASRASSISKVPYVG